MPMLGGCRIDRRVEIRARNTAIKTYLSIISAFVLIAPMDCENHMSTTCPAPDQVPAIAPFLDVRAVQKPLLTLGYGQGRLGTIVVQYGPAS